jgi:hypothetical protein
LAKGLFSEALSGPVFAPCQYKTLWYDISVMTEITEQEKGKL